MNIEGWSLLFITNLKGFKGYCKGNVCQKTAIFMTENVTSISEHFSDMMNDSLPVRILCVTGFLFLL